MKAIYATSSRGGQTVIETTADAGLCMTFAKESGAHEHGHVCAYLARAVWFAESHIATLLATDALARLDGQDAPEDVWTRHVPRPAVLTQRPKSSTSQVNFGQKSSRT